MLQCELCEYGVTHRSSFRIHQRRHTQIQSKCDLCDFQTDIEMNMTKHKKQMHKESPTFQCENCSYKSIKRGNVVKHNESVHQGVRIICDQCDKKFTQHSDLDKHLNKVHGMKIESIFKCDLCEYTTAHRQVLNFHKQRKHDGKTFSCERCTYSGKAEADLVNHRKHCVE